MNSTQRAIAAALTLAALSTPSFADEKPWKEQVSEDAATIANKAKEIGGKVADTAKDVGGKVADTAKDVGAAAKAKATELSDEARARHAAAEAKRQQEERENPGREKAASKHFY